VAGDTVDKSWRAHQAPGSSGAAVAFTCADVFAWQLLASVAIPGLVINQVVKWTGVGIHRVLGRLKAPNPLFVKGMGGSSVAKVVMWGPTAAGLFAVPFIVQPIDHFVDSLFEATVRPWGRARSFLATTNTPTAASTPVTVVTASSPTPFSQKTPTPAAAAAAAPSMVHSSILLAAAPALADACADANKAFLECKRARADPEDCLPQVRGGDDTGFDQFQNV